MDEIIDLNAYETLVWHANGTCATCMAPWLAESYTSSPDLKTWTFTLRQGITFTDGEPLNSTAVYFSLNRFLVMDGSITNAHGVTWAYQDQQLLNRSLSTALCCAQTYGPTYVGNVLGENFVQITGPYTLTIHLMNPTSSFPYIMSAQFNEILAPRFVMQHDLSMWNQSSTGYSLPYPKLSGDLMSQVRDYYYDYAATCDAGVTPGGCGDTFLTESPSTALAGTGPYVIQGWDHVTNEVTLKANPNYWGGNWATKIVPTIQTINIKPIPDQKTRLLDLQGGAKSGQAVISEVAPNHVADVIDRNAWLNQHQLVSTIPGVTVYGPSTGWDTIWWDFPSNVTSSFTGKLLTFQPFADRRFRLAFADTLNLTEINQDFNLGLMQIAPNAIPPGMPPAGSFNASIKPAYSYNPDESATLLLDAMQNPITTFHFYNGTVAPAGVFDNTFGCKTLGSDNRCANPVSQTITIPYLTGVDFDQAIATQMAQAIENISTTYNMGLTVSVVPMGLNTLDTQALYLKSAYMFNLGGNPSSYPWVTDFLLGSFGPISSGFMGYDNHNIPQFFELYNEAVNASAKGDISQLLKVDYEINSLANQYVLYLYMGQPEYITAATSNLHGFVFDPALPLTTTGSGVQYFPAMYIS